MPMINAVKKFTEGGIYHIYNRGVDRGDIFFAEEDFNIFLGLLSRYILGKDVLDCSSKVKSYEGRISLFAFCLLKNHIHLLIRQSDERAISEFMHSLSISFTMKMNNKYKRVGHLFQGIYKARLITTDANLINISRYIHFNAGESREEIIVYPYSSIRMYLGNSIDFSFVDKKMISDLVPKKQYWDFLDSVPDSVRS
jgi:REP element-mobilizing transposase RayT